MCETTPFSVLSNEDLTIIPEESSVEKGKLFVRFVEIRSFWVFAEDFFLRNEDDDGKNFFQFGKYFSQMKQRKRQNHFSVFPIFSWENLFPIWEKLFPTENSENGKTIFQFFPFFSWEKLLPSWEKLFPNENSENGKTIFQLGKPFTKLGKLFSICTTTTIYS